MTRITAVHAREVLDSRGNPTVEVDVHAGNSVGRAIVPSGASTGAAEAHELRDTSVGRYGGRGVLQVVHHVNQLIAPVMLGLDAADQAVIDARLLGLDPSRQKTLLGANAILGVSLAAAHAAAAAQQIPLFEHINSLWKSTPNGTLWTSDPEKTAPYNHAAATHHHTTATQNHGAAGQTAHPAPQPAVLPLKSSAAPAMPLPMTNLISGGLHAGGNLDFQDFLMMPSGASSYSEALEWLVRVNHRLGIVLTESGYEGRLLADEGGYGPRLRDCRHALDMLVQAIVHSGLEPGRDVTIALDVASSHFFRDGRYHLRAEKGIELTSTQMVDYLVALAADYPITSIEDGLAEEDWQGWRELTRRLGAQARLVGDDLFATSPERLRRGIELGVGNSVLIKLNQIGTLSETLETMRLAQAAGYTRVVSARSGETEDTTIADLAVGTAAESIKIGAVKHGERQAKYNQLLRIEERLRGESGKW